MESGFGDGAADIAWIKMIIPDESAPAVVAGSVGVVVA